MKRQNTIIYFEENDNKFNRIVNIEHTDIVDIVPDYTGQKIDAIDFIFEDGMKWTHYFISYQYSFKIKLARGEEFYFKSEENKQIYDDLEFNKKFAKFIEDFHNNRFEPPVTIPIEIYDGPDCLEI